MTYDYFEKDGAIFRMPAGAKIQAVIDVKFPNGWEPYKGDRCSPVVFGNRITPQEAGEVG